MLIFPPMTKAELYQRVAAGPSAVARILGITPSAVSQWPDPIPESRLFELRGRRPDLFAPAADAVTDPALAES